MKTVKRFTGLLVVCGIIFMGVSNAKAGILMSDRAGDNPCSSQTEATDQVDRGIMVSGLAAIFGDEAINKWFGKSNETVDCGIMVSG